MDLCWEFPKGNLKREEGRSGEGWKCSFIGRRNVKWKPFSCQNWDMLIHFRVPSLNRKYHSRLHISGINLLLMKTFEICSNFSSRGKFVVILSQKFAATQKVRSMSMSSSAGARGIVSPWLTGNSAKNLRKIVYEKCTACLWRLRGRSEQQTTYKQANRATSLQVKAQWDTKRQTLTRTHTQSFVRNVANMKQILAKENSRITSQFNAAALATSSTEGEKGWKM